MEKNLNHDFITIQIKSIKTVEKESIMTAIGQNLLTIINESLYFLDEYMQIIADAGDEEIANSFSNDYNQIEKIYHKAKKNSYISLKDRNYIRLAMKNNLKLSANY